MQTEIMKEYIPSWNYCAFQFFPKKKSHFVSSPVSAFDTLMAVAEIAKLTICQKQLSKRHF